MSWGSPWSCIKKMTYLEWRQACGAQKEEWIYLEGALAGDPIHVVRAPYFGVL